MATWIRKSERIRSVSYARYFENVDCPGSGYSFPCDEHGNVALPDNEAGRENLSKCLGGVYNVIDRGIETYSHSYTEPGVIKCHCGRHVTLGSSWANECDNCHREYNQSGQLLAPRSQWGWETGEVF
jgi:hypothetical protein